MPSIDVTDSILVRAPEAKVFETILDYPAFESWIPTYSCRVKSQGGKVEEQALVEHTIKTPFGVSQKLTRRIDRITPTRKIEESYVEGDLAGTGIWHFTPEGDGTRVSYECQVHSTSFLMGIGLLLGGKRGHSMVYQQLLRALRRRCEN